MTKNRSQLYSSRLPDFVGDVLVRFNKSESAELPKENKTVGLRQAQLSQEFVSHGSGVYENKRDGTVWYREDDVIYQRTDPSVEKMIVSANDVNVSQFPESEKLLEVAAANREAYKRIAIFKSFFNKR